MVEFDEEALIDGFVETVAAIPETNIELENAPRLMPFGDRADALARVRTRGKTFWVLIEAKRSAYPRDVREVVWQLRNYLAHAPDSLSPIIPLLAAENLSPGARDFLREEKVGYFDRGGSLYLPAPDTFIFIDKPTSRKARRATESIFSGRSVSVLHAIWAKPDEWFGVHEVAQQARVAPATVSTMFAALEQREWLTTRGSGPAKERRLSDRKALLDAWSEHQLAARQPSTTRYFVPNGDFSDLLHFIDRTFSSNAILYEVTGEAAAQFYAPYLSHLSRIRCRIERSSTIGDALAELEARPVTEGWNLSISDTAALSDFSFRERREDCWIASVLQTYLDLLQAGGRARELADHLRSERLGV